MLQHLLRRLVFDVPILNEYAKMPLKVWGNLKTKLLFEFTCSSSSFLLSLLFSCSFWPTTMNAVGNIIASLMVGLTLEWHQKRNCIWPANCFGGSLNRLHIRWSSCNMRFFFSKIFDGIWAHCNIWILWFQKFDAEIFKISMPCICSIAGAIPPDYVDASYSSKTEKKASVDAEGNFDPKPVETTKWEDFLSF